MPQLQGRLSRRRAALASPLLAAALVTLLARWRPGQLAWVPWGPCAAPSETPGHAAAAPHPSDATSRRTLMALASVAGGAALRPAPAAAKTEKKDLGRLKVGLKGINALIKNWDQETRQCTGAESFASFDGQAGVQDSPDGLIGMCAPAPAKVLKFIGTRNPKHSLWNTKQLWISMQDTDLVPNQKFDEFTDLFEEFEAAKQVADDMAYTSSWGEANPGGGRDVVEKYLIDCKNACKRMQSSLDKILKIVEA